MKFKLLLCLTPILGGGLFAFPVAGRCDFLAAMSPSSQLSTGPALQSIHMIDRETGWAQNARAVLSTNHWIFNDKDVWRTTNGGGSWSQVLDASPAETGNICAFFQDSLRSLQECELPFHQIRRIFVPIAGEIAHGGTGSDDGRVDSQLLGFPVTAAGNFAETPEFGFGRADKFLPDQFRMIGGRNV
jgi:hypothetical protein